MGYKVGFWGHDIWKDFRCGIHQHIRLRISLERMSKEDGALVRKEMGRLREEGFILHLSYSISTARNAAQAKRKSF